jgi:phospholipase C
VDQAAGLPKLGSPRPPTAALLARVYNAVRSSPGWERTALTVTFDEGGGTYDHVPPPAAPVPDDSSGEQGFAFGRFGVRVPTIAISPFTRRGTVVREQSHSDAVLRTIRERFGLGPALTRRDAAAPLLSPAFNLSDPRTDAPTRIRTPSLAGVDPARGEELGDNPDANLFVRKHAGHARERISQLGNAVLRNVAQMVAEDLGDIPVGLPQTRAWLAGRVRAGARGSVTASAGSAGAPGVTPAPRPACPPPAPARREARGGSSRRARRRSPRR